ncbi:hypothetical protein IQ258_27390 [Coleofasciculus sp. LEGE 07081]|uniref:M60 family metallopeptidase n=1 Tax=Coleofasciculus sp. LEGE 07081 TaxID=2777967 RepID=UPI00187E252A|nr:M60 family metallopeptidase [Coleofasciculus sp. LEGE 07081]MBE9129766.1 hypothetical protein [Coleofasciculus sp. LEGE 07081]
MGIVVASLCLGLLGLGDTQLGQPSVELSSLQSDFVRSGARFEVGGAIPGKVIAFGDRAVVLATAKDGKRTSPAIVGADFGSGRVAAFGHGAMLQPQESVLKLLKWLGKPGNTIGVMGKAPTGFEGSGLLFVEVNQQNLKDCSAVILSSNDIGGRFTASTLRQFVSGGKGLLVVDTPWGWLQLNPGKSLSHDHPGNAFLAEMGIGFADGLLDRDGGYMEIFAPRPEHHAKRALEIFKSSEKTEPEVGGVVSDVLTGVLRDGREGSDFVKAVYSTVKARATTSYPLKGKPVLSDDFRGRLGMVFYDLEWRQLTPDRVTAHPAAKDFPGEVGQFESRETAVVPVEAGIRRWRSTGRYAAPGEKISVQLGPAFAGKKVSLRIGGHSDHLWGLDKWERFPAIDLSVSIVDGKAEAANPFGGMVYLVCNTELPEGSAVFQGTLAAPTYVLGRTTVADWKRVRRSGAPWGEIVGKQSAICVPASVLKELDDPVAIALYYDEMVAEAEKLYAVDPGTTEHRYQVDRQISAGYMHAGYPIMTWEDVSKRFVDISVLRGNEGNPNWGFYHELGHNYQRGEWTWNGWGETTNNLFSLYGCEHFNRQIIGHGAMNEADVLKRLAEVKARPGSESFYNKDPWYGLTFWEMMRRDFGFNSFTKYFAWAADKRLPGEQAKKDAFLVELSRITGRDLTRYCEMWGIKFSADAVAKVKQYPEWMPKELK